MMDYLYIPVFLRTGGLTSRTCIYGHGEVLSETARKQVFQTSEGLVASISTKPFCPSGGRFLDQIISDKG